MTVNSNAPEADSAFEREANGYAASQRQVTQRSSDAKWPLVVRLGIILGLSVFFWTLIIAGLVYVFS